MVIFFKYLFIKLNNGKTYLITELRDPPTLDVTSENRYAAL